MKKILIIGQGNIGTFVGVSFQSAGIEVKHFVRNLPTAKKEIICQFRDRRKIHKVKKGTVYSYSIVTDKNKFSEFDFIVIPVAHYHWKSVICDLKPYLRKYQTLILMGNVWNEFEWLDQEILCPYIFVFPNFGGAIIDKKLEGWLTTNFTTGVTTPAFQPNLLYFNLLLQSIGFTPKNEADIKGWLMTHFAWNAGMLTEAAQQNGYQTMTKSFKSLVKMYRLTRECMLVVKQQSVDFLKFQEGRKAAQPLWWNALKTFFIFCLPGLAKSADATKNLKDWSSYGLKILATAKKENQKLELLETYQPLLHELQESKILA